MATKECFKCHEVLPLSAFYAHPMMGDGHLGKCKVCTRRDVQENYVKRRDQYRAYERRRYGPARVAVVKAAIARHPEKHRARRMVHSAISRGQLVRLPCEVCGTTPADAHHDDYSQPLNVRWLCRKHHGEVHRIEDVA